MKTPSERLKDAAEKVFTSKPAPDKPSWSERIALWLLGIVAKSAVKFLEDEEPAARDNVKETLIKIRDNPNTPPELKAMVERALEPHSWIQIAILVVMAVVMVVQAVGTLFPPGLKRMEQSEERLAQTYRLDPISLITGWRRDPEAFERYFDDLRDQGWSDDRIEALKYFTLFMPSAQDLVNWQAKEVFEPAMIAKYGLDDEFEALDLTLFGKIGVTEEQARNYWRAHWEHPELRTIIEMLRRTGFSEDDMREWFRLVEIPPYWRDKLIEISYEVPTRVDGRRWWDMRTIDEARLREIYTHRGYHGEDLDDYVLWTKVYVAFPDLIARWKNGYITLEEVRAELIGYGMPATRVEELIQTKMKVTEGERVAKERDLTKTEIYKGVKKELITWGEGLELLMDLGYDEAEAEYVLEVNVGVLAGSPATFDEFKSLTKGWRKAAGMASETITEKIRQAAAEVVKLTKDLEILQDLVREEEAKLIKEEVLPAEATARRDELRVALHRAEATLAAAQSHYDALVAEWRHKE